MTANLNADAPTGSAPNSLFDAGQQWGIFSSQFDICPTPTTFITHFNASGGDITVYSGALHDLLGFNAIYQSEPFLAIDSVSFRLAPRTVGSLFMGGITHDASGTPDPDFISGLKNVVDRRTTELSMGAETHIVPINKMVSSIMKPYYISGVPYLYLWVQGDMRVTIEISFYRAGGGIIQYKQPTGDDLKRVGLKIAPKTIPSQLTALETIKEDKMANSFASLLHHFLRDKHSDEISLLLQESLLLAERNAQVPELEEAKGEPSNKNA